MAFEKELFVATQAVRRASLFTKRIQAQVISSRDTTTITKSDNSPVTVGDYAAQTIIIHAIKNNFPNDKVVGEESAEGLSDGFLSEILSRVRENDEIFNEHYSSKSNLHFQEASVQSVQEVRDTIDFGNYEGGSKGRFWCIDPIDGTKGFLRGEQFAVCLALIVDGVAQVGVIGCPNLSLSAFGGNDLLGHERFGYIFKAVRGQGSNFASATVDSDWKEAHVRSIDSSEQMVSLEGVEKSHSSHDEQCQIKRFLRITRSLHLDSQVKYCMLAVGLGDLYLRLPRSLDYQEKIWDHAAGNVLLQEAGGIHTDAMQNLPLSFDEGRTLHTKGVIASSGPPEIHDRVVAASHKIIISRSA